MKNRLYFIPVVIIVLTLFVVASIFDLQISTSIANNLNGFSKFFASIATLPVAIFFSFASASILKLTLTRYKNVRKLYKVFLFIYAIGLYVGSIALFGLTVSRHAYTFNAGLGILVGFVSMSPIAYLTYRFFDKFDSPNLFKIIIFMSVVILFSQGSIEGFKIFVPRVRYLAVSEFGNSLYRPWYDPSISKEVADFIKAWGKERSYENCIKSFPSGHSNFAFLSSFILLMLPSVFKLEKIEKYRHILFYCGIFYYFLIAFSRIYGGYHYLSDTMFSGLYSLGVVYIANEIYLRKIEKTFKEGV